MGRGYSNSRSKSARPTVALKRQRSLSLIRLKASMGTESTPTASTNVRPVRGKQPRTPSASSPITPQKARAASGRTRSMSTLRQQVNQMQEEMADALEDSEDERERVAKPDVMTKYKSAGRAVDEVMNLLTAACVAGANTKGLCDTGDAELHTRVRGMFSKAKDGDGNPIARGLCYPTSVSVNEVLCNSSPLSEAEGRVLQGNDVVKLHLGAHIDGYPVSAARTVVVPAEAEERKNRTLTPAAVRAVEAARVALHAITHLLVPGASGDDITDVIHRVGHMFDTQAVEGVLSHRTKRWVQDGVDCFLARRVTTEDPHQEVADCRVGENQVWTIDVAFTDSPSYKTTLSDEQVTVYRRNEMEFPLDARVASVNVTLQDTTKKHHCFPFHIRQLENPLKGKMAIAVLRKHGVMDALPPLRTKGGKHISARFSATVAVTAKRITPLCGVPVEAQNLPAEVAPPQVEDDVAAVLARPLNFAAAGGHPESSGGPAKKKAKIG